MLRATLGEELPIRIQASAGDVGLYARANIYDMSGSLSDTLSLPHIAGGLYGTTYTFNVAGYFTIVYQLFLDSGFTTAADYEISAETLETNSDKINLVRLLGLTHDNTILDSHSYNIDGNLVSVRVRSYDTKSNALAAGVTGLQNTWTISATYSGAQLETYTVVREP